MRIEGGEKLARQLRALPAAQRKHVADALEKSGAEAVRVAKTLVPRDSGALAESIKATSHNGGMTVIIEAGDDTKRGQIQAKTIEGGRAQGSKRGAAAAQPYMKPTRSFLAKKFKGRIARAIRKAAKEVSGG